MLLYFYCFYEIISQNIYHVMLWQCFFILKVQSDRPAVKLLGTNVTSKKEVVQRIDINTNVTMPPFWFLRM